MPQNKPNVVSLTQKEAEGFKDRINDSSLLDDDKKIIFALLSFNFWLQSQLQRASLTILRLKKIFGLPTEKKSSKTNKNPEGTETNPLPPTDPAKAEDNNITSLATVKTQPKKKPKFDPDQNHGRYAASDYTGCDRVSIPHGTLKVGDRCPGCAEASLNGKLGPLLPKEVVKLQGSPIITGTCYECERLRCSLCGDKYEAELPEEIARQPKYDETCLSALAIARYYAGMPSKRLEGLQALQGIPLADATQWDLMNKKLYPIVLLVFQVLETNAAQGQLIHYDDTNNRILEKRHDKKAVHTTAFISTLGAHSIYLFYTSQKHAGENMKSLMSKRTTEDELITMTDASSQNFPKKINPDIVARWVLCFCLVHGRRKFYEVFDYFTEECECVLSILSEVYKHEAHCKKEKLNPQARLAYHQKHSAPLMEALRVWLNNQLLYHLVEDNSGLGKATRYMLKHWDALTRFLSVAGAPIDNSLCEQAIKVAIRHRRNSLFYKTVKGAEVGDCLMSVIYTAAKNKINIFDYLNELQRNQIAVQADPASWLPWNYQDTLDKLSECIELQAA